MNEWMSRWVRVWLNVNTCLQQQHACIHTYINPHVYFFLVTKQKVWIKEQLMWNIRLIYLHNSAIISNSYDKEIILKIFELRKKYTKFGSKIINMSNDENNFGLFINSTEKFTKNLMENVRKKLKINFTMKKWEENNANHSFVYNYLPISVSKTYTSLASTPFLTITLRGSKYGAISVNEISR